MDQTLDLFTAHHDGKTYEPQRDKARLNYQQALVFNAMRDGVWRTLARIHKMTGAPEASISARLRDARKEKFGGHRVERRYVERGLFEYRLIVNEKGASNV
ncbi:MAG TPA: hypothetical protein VNZ47_11850 [Candidatus Dormibacteraeota bacterium]|jgi:hypothetical protein|nr:hypothetical protein [Candidatus Dormibacteraeota bacterium]